MLGIIYTLTIGVSSLKHIRLNDKILKNNKFSQESQYLSQNSNICAIPKIIFQTHCRNIWKARLKKNGTGAAIL